MRMRPRRSPARPHFFWQGTLIVLPALVLAGAGFYSLRQDDVVAQHEAAEQAQRIAVELAEKLIPEALRFDLPDVSAVSRAVTVAEDEWIERLRRSRLVASACLLGPNNALIYPRPFGTMPVPEPLDAGELDPAQQDVWLGFEAMWRGEKRFEPTDADALLPARFGAIQRFRSGVALARRGDVAGARGLLRPLCDPATEAHGESGIPLCWLAQFEMAALWPEAGLERAEELNRLCSRLLTEPSPVTDALFARIADLGPVGRKWDDVRARHEVARGLHASFVAEPAAASIVLDGGDHVLLEQRVEGGRWIMAVPVRALGERVDQLQRSMIKPGHFGIAMSVGPHLLFPRPSTAPALGKARFGSPPIDVEVFLADPGAFSAARRARAMRFGALIGVSAAAVLVGFFAAWRAFRRQQQLSEMKSNFVSSVSHELRAPIASVRLMAEELERGGPPGREKLQQYLRFIGQECRRLSGVIENVLDFSRREQGREQFHFEPTDLAALVEETVSAMQPYASERSVKLETLELGPREPVDADGRALQRVLVNLIDNALKHAPEGSRVTVGLEFAVKRVSLWVEDCGPGIPQAEHERIFERFYRIGSELRRQTQGVGLGLSIVKHVAEIHGGRVVVRSEVGQGSRFTVELPLRPVAPRNDADAGAGESRPAVASDLSA